MKLLWRLYFREKAIQKFLKIRETALFLTEQEGQFDENLFYVQEINKNRKIKFYRLRPPVVFLFN